MQLKEILSVDLSGERDGLYRKMSAKYVTGPRSIRFGLLTGAKRVRCNCLKDDRTQRFQPYGEPL